jgi:lipopolysaccharide biosynthesis glycosyltransferase
MPCPVVLACDASYGMQLATTLRSLVEANRRHWPLDVHILADGFAEPVRLRVGASLPDGSANIRWVPVDLASFAEFATAPHISKMTYCRFLVPRVIDQSVGRVLYLDSDLLVLDDLQPLWDMKLDGAVVGAVLDGLDAELKAGRPGLAAVPHVARYFNAGVLLMDLNRWRRERISERALEYLTAHPRSPFADQDALNLTCDGRWKALDERWNFQDWYEQKRIAELTPAQRPGILHFVYKYKPWDSRVPTLNAALYDSIRSRTSFARTAPERLRDLTQVALYHCRTAPIWTAPHRALVATRALLRRSGVARSTWARLRRLKPMV